MTDAWGERRKAAKRKANGAILTERERYLLGFKPTPEDYDAEAEYLYGINKNQQTYINKLRRRLQGRQVSAAIAGWLIGVLFGALAVLWGLS